MYDNVDAERIMLDLLQGDWRRPPGCPHVTWLSTIQHDLRCHISHSLKQLTWLRIALCGGCCRCQALCILRVACQKRWRR